MRQAMPLRSSVPLTWSQPGSPQRGQARRMNRPWPRHSRQSRPGTPLQSGQRTMRPLPGGVMVAVIIVTSVGAGHFPGCTMAVSGLSLSSGHALKDLAGGGDRRLGWLEDSVAAPFGEDVPGFAEVHFAGFPGRDPHAPALIDPGLAPAVALGDLGNLQRQLGLVVARGEAKDVQGSCFPFSWGDRFGVAGEFGTAVEPRLDPHLAPVLALGVDESFGFSG